MKRFIYILIASTALAVTGCIDNLTGVEPVVEGSACISATLDFRPMSSALTRSGGDALKDISSLYVLLYDSRKNLVMQQKLHEGQQQGAYTLSFEERADSDAENNKSAEAQTGHVSFTLPEISYGTYYMYAVANIPDLLTTYAENIKTVDGLKSIPLTWDNTKDEESGKYNVAGNGQMIGCFSTSTTEKGEGTVTLNKDNVTLHAWLRRAASKVTVAFDGSGLKEGVFIYIQSVQIKDIPSKCYLGKDNTVGGDAPAGTELVDGEIITYHEGHESDNFEYGEACVGHRVTVGSPHLGSHGEKDPALFFYENMQGAGDNMPDKRQDADGNGKLDFPGLPEKPQDPEKEWNYRLKDDVPNGTYIEVQAHYISNNSERLGNGHIVYRFMLGQDHINDYNAKRNCHYKLTLKFKNFANEADWHIEYEEPEPGVMTPEPYYISYLYNHSMMYPVKVNTGGHNIEYIKAEIIENNWAPYNAEDGIYYTGAPNGVDAPWNGFLSMHMTTDPVLYADKIGTNKDYYYKVPKRNERTFTEFTVPDDKTFMDFRTDPDHTDPDDTYRVEKHLTEKNTYNIYIPMYTRAKQMISTTGYTGNNPYVAYQRMAKVRITTKLEGVTDCFYNEVPIYQVRRVVNPKGIYRSFKNNESFHVVLKRLPGEDEQMFKTFQSEGPWKAYVAKRTNGDGITLSVAETAKNTTELKDDPEYGKAIYGKTGSVIDFSVDFSENSSENRYAIIRVEYHNYTCQHLIFVRQGDKPDDLVKNGTKWYAQNMRTTKELASTPLDEGSLFKFANWTHPIDALSNKNPREPWTNVTPKDFQVPGSLINADTKENMTWEGIEKGSGNVFGNPEMEKARVATAKDFWELRGENMNQGYGVLYGDDATETADDIVEAYGYDYEHKKGRGMRGCFAYNKETGKSLFFPIGASGYGHRKQSYTGDWGDPETINGVLRYAAGRTRLYPEPINLPLFYDIYKRPGAIYWFNEQIPKGNETATEESLGWDINYFSFDFNFIGTGNLIKAGGSDACFVRCVVAE